MADDRNLLRRSYDEATLDGLRRRIVMAGGDLGFWGVLDEDTYETMFGDGQYLHLRSVTLTAADAEQLAALAPTTPNQKWHVRHYRLGLADNTPTMLALWPRSEEFRLDDVVELLLQIPLDNTSSGVRIGSV